MMPNPATLRYAPQPVKMRLPATFTLSIYPYEFLKTLKRYLGRSHLSILAHEILGLSKMNWNSFDLYARLPATVHSSDQIARIGSLLGRFETISYDYRLFI